MCEKLLKPIKVLLLIISIVFMIWTAIRIHKIKLYSIPKKKKKNESVEIKTCKKSNDVL